MTAPDTHPTSQTALFQCDAETAQCIAHMMAEEQMTEGGVRLTVVSGNCNGLGYRMSFEDRPMPQDVEYMVHGVRFFIPQFAAQYYEGAVMRLENRPDEPPTVVIVSPGDNGVCCFS